MTYIITGLSPILHDGKMLQKGDPLPSSCTEKEVAELLAMQVIEEASGKASKAHA